MVLVNSNSTAHAGFLPGRVKNVFKLWQKKNSGLKCPLKPQTYTHINTSIRVSRGLILFYFPLHCDPQSWLEHTPLQQQSCLYPGLYTLSFSISRRQRDSGKAIMGSAQENRQDRAEHKAWREYTLLYTFIHT